MPSITEYEIVGYTENNEPIINSTEKCPCTKFMRGVLEYRSHVRRHIRKEVSGEKIWYWIPLGKCDNRNCGSMCRLLPDFMVPYKHYEAEAVSDVLDEVITEESPVDCPSIQTMRHWKAWLYFNKARIESLFRGKGYRENAFAGLRPMNRKMRRSSRLPDNQDEIVGQAIILKREVPRRSARQIIKILEIEGWAGPGVIKQSTLRRYLFKASLGVKQMRRYAEARETSSRRFCRPHRMELIQCDVKYGPDIRTKDGKLIHTYLSSLIDDHSRYILHSEFYDNKSASIVEDSVHKAILQHGKFDCSYTDNGKEYISTQLVKSCARLGIRLLRAKPRRGESKGKIEKFHQVCDSFISEIRIAKVHTLEELNRRWKVFLDQDYRKDPHDGIREYYESMDVNVPEEGISPLQEWNRDSREVVFIDAGVVGEAFLHHENRVIDPAGCFSFNGFMYEASTALAGARVEISYDPLDTSLITVNYQGMEPIRAKRVTISPYAQKKPPVPVAMTDAVPETSRFLDALEKRYKEENRMAADAISFVSSYQMNVENKEQSRFCGCFLFYKEEEQIVCDAE